MKISSCKNKGRIGQQEVVRLLLRHLSEFAEEDIRSRPMGSRGEDIMLSQAALKRIPWNIEVKRGKAFNLVNACKQAQSRTKRNLEPVAFGRYDRDKQWYACIRLEYLLELI